MSDKATALLIALCVIVFCTLFYSYVETSQNSHCRDNGYPDAVHIRNQGWYCVGISESNEPFLVEFEEATK